MKPAHHVRLLKTTMPGRTRRPLRSTLALGSAGHPGGHRGGPPENRKPPKVVQPSRQAPPSRLHQPGRDRAVELGGAIKNVVALAAAWRGLGLATTPRGLVTRGLAEMRPAGNRARRHPETFSGLSGLGDLAVTCFFRA